MKRFLISAISFLTVISLPAQVPQAINYQTIVRSANGMVTANQVVKLGFVIHQGSPQLVLACCVALLHSATRIELHYAPVCG